MVEDLAPYNLNNVWDAVIAAWDVKDAVIAAWDVKDAVIAAWV